MPCWWTANILLYPAPSKILGILSKPWQLSYLVLLSAHKPISNIFRVLGKTWHFYIFKSCYECAHTNCATTKAVSSSPPGRSVIDHLLDLVTKITAWLIMLTCKYRAVVMRLLLQLMLLTWKSFYTRRGTTTILLSSTKNILPQRITPMSSNKSKRKLQNTLAFFIILQMPFCQPSLKQMYVLFEQFYGPIIFFFLNYIWYFRNKTVTHPIFSLSRVKEKL